MERGITGLHRLRGALPKDTIVADKTGSGDNDPVTGAAKATTMSVSSLFRPVEVIWRSQFW